jgi:predicted Zn-dependent peptidase
MQFQHATHQHMGLHTLKTAKFKTTALVLNIQRPLQVPNLTRAALLPHVLLRGSEQYPSVRSLQIGLDRMYGSHLSGDAYKLGERQILHFYLEFPDGNYLQGKPELLNEAIAFLASVLRAPLQEEGAFKASFVALEKEALRKRFEGLFNHKARYATFRCIEVMCPNEPYRYYAGGRAEDLASITPSDLQAEYESVWRDAPMDLFVVGNVEASSVEAAVRASFTFNNRAPQAVVPTGTLSEATSENHVIDRMDVTQGQLVVGLRTPVTYASDTYYAMLMYNGILGTFAHSKLFMQVRERHGLAYSVRSRFEPHKGLLFIQAGIDVDKETQTTALIREQLAAMAQGDISEQELELTRALLLNSYKEAYDSPGALINLAYESLIGGRERTIEELQAFIPAITREDIVKVAQQVKIDTIYFLRDKASAAKQLV